jgi:hypothetical protein
VGRDIFELTREQIQMTPTSLLRTALASRILAAAFFILLLHPSKPLHAQGGDAFSGSGTIVWVQGRSVEFGGSWYLEAPDGHRIDIFSCGKVEYMKYRQQEVEVEGRFIQNNALCIDKLITLADKRAAEEKRRAEEEEVATRPARRKAIAQKYAPLVYLASGETWLPSSIDFYAANVRLNCGNGKTVRENILELANPIVLPANECFFVPKQRLSGPYDQPSWLHGQDPTKTSVPIYVFIYPDESGEASDSTHMSFYAQYMTFYPYNYGKNACVSLAPFDNCLSPRVMLGNHVADWELVTIRFREGRPAAVHVGAHGNDIPDTAYTFRAPAWSESGQPRGWTLQWEGEHPIAYSAAGSHGTYGWEGKHNYKSIVTGEQLNDYTSKGVRWETWKNVVFADDPKYDFLLNNYDGRWGNPHMGKSACDLNPLPNFVCGKFKIPTEDYQLSDGPNLPDRKRDKSYM